VVRFFEAISGLEAALVPHGEPRSGSGYRYQFWYRFSEIYCSFPNIGTKIGITKRPPDLVTLRHSGQNWALEKRDQNRHFSETRIGLVFQSQNARLSRKKKQVSRKELIDTQAKKVWIGLARQRLKSVAFDEDGQRDRNAYIIIESRALLKG